MAECNSCQHGIVCHMKDTREKDDAPCSYMDLVEATRTPQGVAVGCGDVGKIADEMDAWASGASWVIPRTATELHRWAKRLRSLAHGRATRDKLECGTSDCVCNEGGVCDCHQWKPREGVW